MNTTDTTPPTGDTPTVSFADLGLSETLLKAIVEVGYTTPTPIQAQAIPPALMTRDVIGIAQTGTGKTASFTLPLLEILQAGRSKARMPRALVLSPTRELAAQIQENFVAYGKYTGLTSALLVGGDAMGEQTSLLERGVDVLIATPGRLLDHFGRGRVLLTAVKILVIDEADRMLDMGFIPDLEKIVSMLPKMRQTLMFTATMPPSIQRIADQFLSNPKLITVSRPSSTAANVTQHIVRTTVKDKNHALLALIKGKEDQSTLVFCNRKQDVDKVLRVLQVQKLQCVAIHGNMPQSKRYENLNAFKAGTAKIIVCSDVAARGLDIDDVMRVINYDLPYKDEDYVHRIGRTGRAGKSGETIALVTPEQDKHLDAIEHLIQKKLPVMELPLSRGTVPAQQKTPGPAPKSATPPQAAVPAKHSVQALPVKADTSKHEPRQPHVKPQPQKTAPRRDNQDDGDDNSVKGFGFDLPGFMQG